MFSEKINKLLNQLTTINIFQQLSTEPLPVMNIHEDLLYFTDTQMFYTYDGTGTVVISENEFLDWVRYQKFKQIVQVELNTMQSDIDKLENNSTVADETTIERISISSDPEAVINGNVSRVYKYAPNQPAKFEVDFSSNPHLIEGDFTDYSYYAPDALPDQTGRTLTIVLSDLVAMDEQQDATPYNGTYTAICKRLDAENYPLKYTFYPVVETDGVWRCRTLSEIGLTGENDIQIVSGNAEITGAVVGVNYFRIKDDGIVNSNIKSDAGIEESKLSLDYSTSSLYLAFVNSQKKATAVLEGVANAPVENGKTIGIGKDNFYFYNSTYDVPLLGFEDYIYVDLKDYSVPAQGKLKLTTNPTAGDTMTIDDKTYTFVAIEDFDTEWEIPIGTTAADTRNNILAAIEGTDGVNSKHPTVYSTDSDTTYIYLESYVYGVIGNSIVTTETFTSDNNYFDGATLGTMQAGVDCTVEDAVSAFVDEYNQHSTEFYKATLSGDTDVIITSKIPGEDLAGLGLYSDSTSLVWDNSITYMPD